MQLASFLDKVFKKDGFILIDANSKSYIIGTPKSNNPIKFIETFLFQFFNPKGVLIGIIIVSTYVEQGEHYLNYATQVIVFAFLVSLSSITFWTFVGKYLRKFATNDKFIKYFNCVMSVLLLLSIITFYI